MCTLFIYIYFHFEADSLKPDTHPAPVCGKDGWEHQVTCDVLWELYQDRAVGNVQGIILGML